MIRPGLCSVTFRALDPEALIELAADTGVAAIEWGADKHLPPCDPELARRISALCAEKGVLSVSYGSYVRAGTAGCLQEFDAVLATAAVLGAGNIRVWAGTAKRAEAGAAAFEAAAGDLAQMARRAAAEGITVSVEYHRNSLTEEAEDTAALMQAAGDDNLFSYWQPVPGRGRARWLEELRLLQPWLGDLHVFYWIMTEAGQDRRPLGEGVEDWRALIDAWTPAPHWPHPRTGFLEFVRDDGAEQFRDDMQHLLALCRQPADAT
ncbi:sugar phosphate isomerase/epimerase family protein [Marinovum sp.]|uniref:sugar phosphate isomerase/epimerase family protein n=1 Tax=Marinovum sp. TaxID=2024839 RepID=UPI002B275C2C|nr:TIM barrel protein [Marinovum sp.]